MRVESENISYLLSQLSTLNSQLSTLTKRVVRNVPKKIPMRQCVGCREMKPKKELIRVVRSPEGQVSLDFRGKLPGRGAYVCPNAACLTKARKSKA